MSASSFVTSMSIQNKSFLSATIVNKFSFNEIPSWHKITISAYPTHCTSRSPTWFVPSCNTIISTMDLKHERIFRNNKLAITSIYFLHGTKWRAFSANRHVLPVFRLSKVKEIICTVDNTGLALSGFLQRGGSWRNQRSWPWRVQARLNGFIKAPSSQATNDYIQHKHLHPHPLLDTSKDPPLWKAWLRVHNACLACLEWCYIRS